MPKINVNFEWRKWMTLATLSVTFFILSYLMAVTMPDCSPCRAGEANAMQVFHITFIITFTIGCVGCAIASLITWGDD